MAIGELMQLASLVKDLVSSKRELNNEYFERFIQPTWELFSKIHIDYKDSLRKYSEMINANDISADEIIKQIWQDIILTEDLRSELGKMFGNLPYRDFATEQEKDLISNFMENIYFYFQSQKEVYVRKGQQDQTLLLNYNGDIWSKDYIPKNAHRTVLLIYLSRKAKPTGFDEGTREITRQFFEKVTADIQRKYREVAGAYYKLKSSLIA